MTFKRKLMYTNKSPRRIDRKAGARNKKIIKPLYSRPCYLGEIEKQKTHSETKLPESLDYTRLPGLSNELKQKLTEFAPKTIGHAARIQGITPAALSVLLVHLKKQKIKRAQSQ